MPRCVCVCTCTCMQVCAYEHVHECACVLASVCSYVSTHMCAYEHVYAYRLEEPIVIKINYLYLRRTKTLYTQVFNTSDVLYSYTIKMVDVLR